MVRNQDRLKRSGFKSPKKNASGLNLFGLQRIRNEPTPSLLKTAGKRFIYALQSSQRNISVKLNSPPAEELKDILKHSQHKDVFSFEDTDLPLQKSTPNTNENSSKKHIPRKNRMRDKFGKRSRRVMMVNPLNLKAVTTKGDDELPVMSQQHSRAFSSSPDAPQYEIATLSLSDSEDDEDLMGPPFSSKDECRKLIVFPPSPAKGGIAVFEEDLKCLEEGEFLNDIIVDFYLRYLVCEQLGNEDRTKCHVFSSFFFKHLTQDNNNNKQFPAHPDLSIQERRHNRVKTWTRNVNLFEKDFIFVPINQMAHWYLAVICFPGMISQPSDPDPHSDQMHSAEYLHDLPPHNPMSLFFTPEPSKQLSRWIHSRDDLDKSMCLFSDDESENDVQTVLKKVILDNEDRICKRPCILIMDSLSFGKRSSVVKILREYLEEEWKVKMGSQLSFRKMRGWSVLVPQQDNSTDCGIYLLQYVESFLKDPPQSFSKEMDLEHWFSQKLVKKKRQQISKLILGLHLQQKV